MPVYSVYLIDANGRVRQGDPLDGRTDADAITLFRALDRSGGAAELWLGGRLIAQMSVDGEISVSGVPEA